MFSSYIPQHVHGCDDGQAGLDLQYLTARYNRGKLAVGDLIQKRHSIVTHRTVSLAHGDVVEKQASLGAAALLSCTYGAADNIQTISLKLPV